MNIKLTLTKETEGELWFDIIDQDTNSNIGYLFTIGNHIAYEIKEEFRGKGAATEALRLITKKLNRPVLEITHDNLASKRVAEKVGYVLARENRALEIYMQNNDVQELHHRR